tara:strand:- start:3 stop:635 length:633 start_codon:yes stop_codon:yes gene_type:complete
MIEVQCEFILKMKEVEDKATELFKFGTTEIFPILKWNGRIQQKIVGEIQQSIFSLTSSWDNLSVWNNEFQNALSNKKFNNWYKKIFEISLYGGSWNVSQLIEPYTFANNESGIIEIQSSYIVPFKNINEAIKTMQEGLNQNILKGHCSQRIFGPNAQTLFTWSSFWDSFSAWEKAIYDRPQEVFVKSEDWFAKWTDIIDFGGPKEVYKNL